MKEHPILFSGEMVRAILRRHKNQTRRVIQIYHRKGCFWAHHDGDPTPYEWVETGTGLSGYDYRQLCRCIIERCPWKVGDRLWVRERHYRWTGCGSPPKSFVLSPDDERYQARCYADHPEIYSLIGGACVKSMPSIHMPRWASRINLEITMIRVQRLQEISEDDADAEGTWRECGCVEGCEICAIGYLEYFREYWNSINSKRGFGWDKNPWVWAITFKLLE